MTYVEHAPLILALEDQHGEGRQEEGAEEARRPQLPGQLLLASPGEDPLHQADDVERGEDIEDLEYYVVDILAAAEQIGVAGEEDDAVEHLGDERDACLQPLVSTSFLQGARLPRVCGGKLSRSCPYLQHFGCGVSRS